MTVSSTETYYPTAEEDILAHKPYPIYEFGNGRKKFLSTFNPPAIYEKPVEIVNGVTIHLPDPDFLATPDE